MLKFYCLQLMDTTDTLDKTTRNRKSKKRRKSFNACVCAVALYNLTV